MEQEAPEAEIPEPEPASPEILEQKPEPVSITIPLEQDADLHQAHVDRGVSGPARG